MISKRGRLIAANIVTTQPAPSQQALHRKLTVPGGKLTQSEPVGCSTLLTLLLLQCLDEMMTQLGISHTLDAYEGTDISKIEESVEAKVPLLFSKNLSFGSSRK